MASGACASSGTSLGGQATGAGKTHTMLGYAEDVGVMVLTMRELFERIDQFRNTREIKVRKHFVGASLARAAVETQLEARCSLCAYPPHGRSRFQCWRSTMRPFATS